MNIHQAARRVLYAEELPYLEQLGLCRLLRSFGADRAYGEMALFNDGHSEWLPELGFWTHARFNLICLLAHSNPEDFQ